MTARESAAAQKAPREKAASKPRVRDEEREVAAQPTPGHEGLPSVDEEVEEEIALSSSVPPVDLKEMKRKQIHELAQMAREFHVEGASTMRKPSSRCRA